MVTLRWRYISEGSNTSCYSILTFHRLTISMNRWIGQCYIGLYHYKFFSSIKGLVINVCGWKETSKVINGNFNGGADFRLSEINWANKTHLLEANRWVSFYRKFDHCPTRFELPFVLPPLHGSVRMQTKQNRLQGLQGCMSRDFWKASHANFCDLSPLLQWARIPLWRGGALRYCFFT